MTTGFVCVCACVRASVRVVVTKMKISPKCSLPMLKDFRFSLFLSWVFFADFQLQNTIFSRVTVKLFKLRSTPKDLV